MKKMLVRAAILAMFTTGATTAIGVTEASAAPNCWSGANLLADTMPQVNYGDSGQNVLLLQLALRDRAGHTELQGTGNYAGNTLVAVKDFQRKHGIKDSGIVGSKTWHALLQNVRTIYGAPNYQILPGEYNMNKQIDLINALIYIYPYYGHDMPNEAGYYGPQTQALVRDFQRRAGIKDSGIVGPKTWFAMYQAIAVGQYRPC